MSGLVTDGPAVASPSRSGGRRAWLVIAAIVLACAVGIGLLRPDSPNDDPLDPENPGGEGTSAVVGALRDHGVEVDVVRSASALRAADTDESTAIVVSGSAALGRRPAAELRESTHASLTVLDPSPGVLDVLGLEVGSKQAEVGTELRGDCPEMPVLDGLRIEVAGGTGFAAPGCFTTDSRRLIATTDGVQLVGVGQVFANAELLVADHAAVAIRLLGQQRRLVWYVPDPADQTSADAVGLGSVLPAWLQPALLMVLAAVIATMFWRGRRLGPLLREPLPAVVRAVEPTLSRGHLYHRCRDREHAAAALRLASCGRLSARLGGPRAMGGSLFDLRHRDAGALTQLIATVAATTAREPVQIAALLDVRAPAPSTDAELTRLGQDLIALEEEVAQQ